MYNFKTICTGIESSFYYCEGMEKFIIAFNRKAKFKRNEFHLLLKIHNANFEFFKSISIIFLYSIDYVVQPSSNSALSTVIVTSQYPNTRQGQCLHCV